MSRRRTGSILLIVCLVIGLYSRRELVAASPNIVLILADDLGYGDLSCQNPSSRIQTPRLDSLAGQGMMFTSAHAPSALCTPSRYSIMTGQFCWRSRLKSGVLNMWDDPLLAPERLTVADMLRKAGYATGYFGKWHLGLAWSFLRSVPAGFDPTVGCSDIDWTRAVRGGPLDHGFDYFFGINIPNQPPYAYILNDRSVGIPNTDYETVTGLQSHWAGPGVPGWDWSLVLPTVVSNAEAWVEQSTTQSPARPFFLYLALPGPHQPVVPTAQFTGTSQAGLYGDYVQELDWAVGRLLDKLEATGAATNTLVLFTSDNGPDEFTYDRLQQYGHCSMGPLRGIKSDLWEGGHRVPFIARWPGKVAAQSTNAQIVCHVDLMRTLADIVGSKLPADAAEDSISFLPALLGNPSGLMRSSLILESGPGQFGFRTNNWMFIDASTGDGHNPELEPLWFKQSRAYPLTNAYPALLYDLAGDLKEATNLYARQLGWARQLQSELRKQRSALAWSGLTSGDWSNCNNWSRLCSPEGCDLFYTNAAGISNFTQTLGTNFGINSLSVGNITQPLSLRSVGGSSLSISNGIDLCAAKANLLIQAPLCVAGSQSWNVGTNRTLTMAGPVSLKTGTELTLSGAGNVVFSNSVSGAGRLVLRGSGCVVLAAGNGFNGGTEVSGGGFLVAQHNNALGPGELEIPNNSSLQVEPGVTLTNSARISGGGAIFQNLDRGAVTVYHPGQARLNGPVTLSGDTGVHANQAGTVLIFGGPISGSANLTIMPGTGTVVFAAQNLYRGATIVQGKLRLEGGADRLPRGTRVCLANSSRATLDLNGNAQVVGSLCGGGAEGGNVALGAATLVLDAEESSVYAGNILGAGGLVKSNVGTVTLLGSCSYQGTTLINGGTLLVEGSLTGCGVLVTNATLGGTGVINAPVRVEHGGWLAPGQGIGTLTISNSLSLAAGSTTAIDLDARSQTCDAVQGLTHIVYGGKLLVNNLAGAATLAAGQSFLIFKSSTAEGQFSSIEPPPESGLAWSFSPSTGILKVISLPMLHVTRAPAGTLVVSWSDPTFHLQAQTNSLSGERTNWFDYPAGSGSAMVVPPIPGHALFLRLVSP